VTDDGTLRGVAPVLGEGGGHEVVECAGEVELFKDWGVSKQIRRWLGQVASSPWVVKLKKPQGCKKACSRVALLPRHPQGASDHKKQHAGHADLAQFHALSALTIRQMLLQPPLGALALHLAPRRDDNERVSHVLELEERLARAGNRARLLHQAGAVQVRLGVSGKLKVG
jgi:hypothetical protein